MCGNMRHALSRPITTTQCFFCSTRGSQTVSKRIFLRRADAIRCESTEPVAKRARQARAQTNCSQQREAVRSIEMEGGRWSEQRRCTLRHKGATFKSLRKETVRRRHGRERARRSTRHDATFFGYFLRKVRQRPRTRALLTREGLARGKMEHAGCRCVRRRPPPSTRNGFRHSHPRSRPREERHLARLETKHRPSRN